MKAALNQLVDQILEATDKELVANKSVVDQIVYMLCDITAIELHPPIFIDDGATETGKGKAVSMVTAAQCAEEYMRTQVFLRGVYQAIQEQLESKPYIQLLYAGTGPFGLLVLPLLHRFSPDQIRLTLLDIHSESLAALSKVTELLEVGDYIESIECVDILQWPVSDLPQFDLIVSETMKAMLDQEPQVSIFSHLIPALKSDGQLIPQQIVIRSSLVSSDANGVLSIDIGEVFNLNKSTVQALYQGDDRCLSGHLLVPDYPDVSADLKFNTDIQVYNGHWLKENHCSLNLPRVIINASPKPNSVIEFAYCMQGYPGFDFNYDSKLSAFSLEGIPDYNELTDSGYPFMKSYWYQCQLIKNNIALSDMVLHYVFISAFDVESHRLIEAAYNSFNFEGFERFVLENMTAEEIVGGIEKIKNELWAAD